MPRTSATPKYRLYRPKNLAVVRIDGRDFYRGVDSSVYSRRFPRVVAIPSGGGTLDGRKDTQHPPSANRCSSDQSREATARKRLGERDIGSRTNRHVAFPEASCRSHGPS